MFVLYVGDCCIKRCAYMVFMRTLWTNVFTAGVGSGGYFRCYMDWRIVEYSSRNHKEVCVSCVFLFDMHTCCRSLNIAMVFVEDGYDY